MDKVFYFNTKEEILDFACFVRDECEAFSKTDTQNPAFWEYHTEKLSREIDEMKKDTVTKENCDVRINASDSVVLKIARSLQDEKEIDKLRALQNEKERLAKKRLNLKFKQKYRDNRFFGLGYLYERTIRLSKFKKYCDTLDKIDADMLECERKKDEINKYRNSPKMVHDYFLYYDRKKEEQNEKQPDKKAVKELFVMKKENVKSLKGQTLVAEKELSDER